MKCPIWAELNKYFKGLHSSGKYIFVSNYIN